MLRKMQRGWRISESPHYQARSNLCRCRFRRDASNGFKSDEKAIELYDRTIKVADDEGDITTRRLFEEILGQEAEHHNIFPKLLVGIVGLSQPEP